MTAPPRRQVNATSTLRRNLNPSVISSALRRNLNPSVVSAHVVVVVVEPYAQQRLSPRIPRRALFGDQVIGYDSEEQETDSDHPSVPSLLTVSETEDEADSADDGATDNATDNESDTDSDYDSLPSLLTESTRYSPARNLCTRDLCTPCTHTARRTRARGLSARPASTPPTPTALTPTALHTASLKLCLSFVHV